MKRLFNFFLAASLFYSLPLFSQNYLNLRYTDGSDKNVPFAALQKITLDETAGNVKIRLTNATTHTVVLTSLQKMTFADVGAGTLLTQVFEASIGGAPLKFVLAQNFPNPFNPSTTIAYQIPVDGFITIKVYDAVGREVASLVNESKKAGSYEVSFDGSRLSSGMYICRMSAAAYTSVTKMSIVK